jgi:hypothetical protein
MNISYSRVASYLRCPYSHYLGYEIGVKPKKPSRPLYFGSDFHKLLEYRKDPVKIEGIKNEIMEAYYEKLTPQQQTDLGEDYLSTLFNIFDDYREVYKDAPQPSVTEHEFNLDLFTLNGEPYTFKGVIDELYKRKSRTTGEKFLKVGEHKTFSRKPDNNSLVMNTQKNLYAKAAQILFGILPRSVIWDYISSKPAHEPVWLEKSGRLSTARPETVTPYSYLRACRANGITDPVELAKADSFKGNVPTYFFRVEQDYDPVTVEAIWKGFVYQAHLIAEHGKDNKTKNLTRDCSWCQYKDLCYTELAGGNLGYLIDRDFEVKGRNDIQTKERKACEPIFQQFEVPF